MKRELSWTDGQEVQADGAGERLYVGRFSRVGLDARHHDDIMDHTLALEQLDEDRRISAAGAFLMFMFGFGCGVFWTIVLTWLF